MKWDIYGAVSGTKYIGQVEAESEEEAVEKGCELDGCCVCLCHVCASECQDPEIQEVIAEPCEEDSP